MTVLSDAEIEAEAARLSDEMVAPSLLPWHTRPEWAKRLWVNFGRAVEKATLAKFSDARLDNAESACRAYGLVTEREARVRERAAWDECWVFIHRLAGHGILGSRYDYPAKERDARYPSLKPVEPPPLVLSTGKYRKPHGSVKWQHELTPLEYNTYWTPDIQTPADARALADWLERWSDK
jgi:hypothetical protein